MGRKKAIPPIKMTIWKTREKRYFVDPEELKAAIRACGRSDDELRRRMGAGFHLLGDLLSGKDVDGWDITFVEHGIARDAIEVHHWHWHGMSESSKP